MPATKGDAPADASVDATGHQDQHGNAPVDAMGRPMTAEGNNNNLALFALQVAAVSGCMATVQSIQTSCLSLCNACREHVPVERLRISHGVPPSILAIAYPGLQQTGTAGSSRVSPPVRVLAVHWTFANSPRLGMFLSTTAQIEQDTRDDTDLAVVGNVDMSEIQWPQGTREIALCAYNRCLDVVPWPSRLERLWLGEPNAADSTTCRIPDTFNKPLDGVEFPCGLREIYLGDRFDQSLEDTAWPEGLERLSLPGYNQPIRDAKWPPGLKALEFVSPSRIRLWKDGGTVDDFNKCHLACIKGRRLFGKQGQGCFNQPLGTALPPSLETLWLSSAFNQTLEGVAWPSGMLTLGLAFDLDIYVFADSITWPTSIRDLCLVDKSLREMRFPIGAKVSTLDSCAEESSHSSRDDYGDRDVCCQNDCNCCTYYDSNRGVDQWRVDGYNY